MGHSAGGFSSLFASSYMHFGVRAVINFAGGRGAKGSNAICSEQALVNSLSYAGKTSRVPSMWIYNENDKAFSPMLAQSMLDAFTKSGGQGELRILPPFQNDGHRLFSDIRGISIWKPIVEDFLKKMGMCPLCQ